MMFWLLGARRRRSERESARVVDLAAWNKGSDLVTMIARADALSPVAHTLPAVDPDVADSRLMVTQLIADLAERGALDSGTGDVLDYWLDQQKDEWIGRVRAQGHSRRETLERLLSQHVQNLIHETAVLEELRKRADNAETTVAHYRDQLNGHPVAVAPPTEPADLVAEPVVPCTPELPQGHLSRLPQHPER